MARPSHTLSRRALARLLAPAPIVLAARRAIAQGAAWSMATEYGATTVSGEAVGFFANRMAKESSGKITIDPAYDTPRGLTSADIVAAIRDGRLAAGDSFSGALGRIDPLFLLSSLPFVAMGPAEARRLLDAARGLYASRFLREKQRLLYATPWPASGLWAKKPIVTPADLAGLPLRVYDATGFELFASAGARPVNLSFAETMPHIVDGSIQAVLSSGDRGAGRKLWEHLPYFTEIGYAMALSFGTLGQPIYDGLPADLQGVVDRGAEATQAWLWELLTRRIEQNHAWLEANKVTIVANDRVSPELRAALVQAASSAIENWKQQAGPQAAAVLDAQRR
jgi:TRAP-type C4-dicarboxylate transport system substrate-binding protein